ncbi:MAG: cardiolipin synthase [Tannerellaceae bacterium]|nr:cardiolipin synthase [Tannerellaceae bacterium]
MLAFISIPTLVGSLILLAYFITIGGLILVIILENRNPLKAIPWIIVLMLLPGISLVFYFLFGQDNRKQRVVSRHTYKRIMKSSLGGELSHDAGRVPDAYRPLSRLLAHNRLSGLSYGSRISVYTNGADKFAALFEELMKATHHIHFQYYIFLDDEIGRQVKDILVSKSRSGVKVRVLYDAVGSWNAKRSFHREMRQAGIEVYSFLRVAFPNLTNKMNYRNHRKVVVIDGTVGFIGGMNVADRYIKGNSLGNWRDTHFKIKGQGVRGLQSAFLLDWYVASKNLLGGSIYYPRAKAYSDNVMQTLTSGPIGQWRLLLQAMIFLVTNAKSYIYIQTPYFLPTEGLNQALQMAALGGVDVRLMLPRRSDTRSASIASHSYIDDMVKAGAKIYLYDNGFLHSKLVVSDDMLTCIGSANIDFRSFEHNFEITSFVYHKDFAVQMKKIFIRDQSDCEKLNAAVWLKRPLKTRMAESFMRLFSPLL